MKKKKRRKALAGKFPDENVKEALWEYFDDDLEEDDYCEEEVRGEGQPEDAEYLDGDEEDEYPEEDEYEEEYDERECAEEEYEEGEYIEGEYEEGEYGKGNGSSAAYKGKKAAVHKKKRKRRVKCSRTEEKRRAKDRRRKRRYGSRHVDAADCAAAAAGILILAGAAALGSFYVNMHTEARQVASFEEIGTQMEGITVVGESGLLAMAEEQNRKAVAEAEAAEEAAAVKTYEEKELDAKGSTAVEMHLSSMQKDLKIKFVNKETGRLISSVPFEVTVTDADKKTYVLKDEDMDGIIYQSGAAPGPCSVTMNEAERAEEYAISTEGVTVTIKDTIEYKKVDVSDEIKKESEVNAAVEDTKRAASEESALTDTVGFVESTKKTTETPPDVVENEEYEEVSKDEAVEPAGDDNAALADQNGSPLYVTDEEGNFREAVGADYNTAEKFYRKKEEIQEEAQEAVQEEEEYQYTGWQTIDGKTYYFDADGNKVTGEQVIQGARYSFDSEGVLSTASGNMGIDVSKWNGSIDWNAVKNAGVSYVIIRCGYRGSTTGALIEDPMFRTNIQGAASAGLKVGIYFVTQAVNEAEAVEEASMTLGLISGYHISYPVFLDVEPGGGRADGISREMRTAVCRAFCQTMENSGYKAGIYSNSTWLNEKIDAPGLTNYKIWLAQYTAEPTYTTTKYDIWQYSAKGTVAGIQGETDLNISYLGY
jgi:Lyzozyme M1 (1,4-beta-N-acetylmuramidase)